MEPGKLLSFSPTAERQSDDEAAEEEEQLFEQLVVSVKSKGSSLTFSKLRLVGLHFGKAVVAFADAVEPVDSLAVSRTWLPELVAVMLMAPFEFFTKSKRSLLMKLLATDCSFEGCIKGVCSGVRAVGFSTAVLTVGTLTIGAMLTSAGVGSTFCCVALRLPSSLTATVALGLPLEAGTNGGGVVGEAMILPPAVIVLLALVLELFDLPRF